MHSKWHRAAGTTARSLRGFVADDAVDLRQIGNDQADAKERREIDGYSVVVNMAATIFMKACIDCGAGPQGRQRCLHGVVWMLAAEYPQCMRRRQQQRRRRRRW